MGLAVTPGSGATVAMDQVGTPGAPTTGEKLQYVKLDGGAAGASAPLENGTATNLAAQTSAKALLATRPGQWVVTHAPAAAAQATASKSAGAAGVRHVFTGGVVTVVGGASAPTAALVTVNLRDGATGAGAILATFTLAVSAVAGVCNVLPLSGFNIPGTAATAMTLETAAATGTNVSASVTLCGYSASG